MCTVSEYYELYSNTHITVFECVCTLFEHVCTVLNSNMCVFEHYIRTCTVFECVCTECVLYSNMYCIRIPVQHVLYSHVHHIRMCTVFECVLYPNMY